MSISQALSIPEYLTHIRGVFYTHLSPILEARRTVNRIPRNDTTSIYIDVPFKDKSSFRGILSLIPTDGGFEIRRYSYEYERTSGYYFQYEFELDSSYKEYISDSEVPNCYIYKPRSHLHVGARKELADNLQGFPVSLREHDGPHYYSIPISLDYVLALIVSNYFPNDVDDLSFLHLADYVHPFESN